MSDQDKTKEQLISEVENLQQRVAALEGCESHRAEEALRQSESRYRALAESTRDIIFILNRQGTLLYANQAASQCIGIPAAEIVGKRQVDLFPPEMAGSQIERIGRVFTTGGVIEYDDLFHFGPAEVWLRINLIPLRDEASQITSVMGVCHNITDRKRAEEALQAAHVELERRVEERTVELTQANEQLRHEIEDRKRVEDVLKRERRALKHMLKASDHERQLIAYDIHDGLAQELAGAIMQFQICDHARKANRKDAAKAFDVGITLLQRSHVEARRLISGVRPPILDESGVVAAIVHLVYDPAFDQGPKIDFRNRVTFTRLAPVLESVVYRIVQEGLTNARNHSKSKKILVSLRQRDDRLRIEIRDWGVGFDPKTRQENRFGLQGIRERARLLGGKCSIRSTPGAGTVVVVDLPVVEREPEP